MGNGNMCWFRWCFYAITRKWKVKNKQEYLIADVKILLSVIHKYFTSSYNISKPFVLGKDTWTFSKQSVQAYYIPCYNSKVDMCHKRLQIHLKLLKVFPTSFAKLLFETFFLLLLPTRD